MVDVPDAVVQVVADWTERGRPALPAIPWPRNRWASTFPEYLELLADLPDALDREIVARHGRVTASGPHEAVRALLTVMAWGFGSVGYGPWRTRRILESVPDAPTRLCDAARALKTEGAVAAYAAMATRCRLRGLGPAFGTKYLHFCSSDATPGVALVLDRLVANWLDSNTDLSLNPVPWSVRTYERYLEHMATWSGAVRVAPSELECCIFQAEAAKRRRSQWAHS